MSESAGKSLLEARFGHVLARLMPCWGDPEAFHLVFDELVYDRRGGRSGWPLDAFTELEFLQQIHDLAYGPYAAEHDAWDNVSDRD